MEIQGKTYYELLGITREASREEIKRAYRDIAQVYHPDSNFYAEILDEKLSAAQLEIFKAITSAYHTLMNENERKLYDATLAPRLQGWDTSTELRVPKNQYKAAPQANKSASYAFGTFGVKLGEEPKPESAFEGDALQSEVPPEPERVRAMSEIIGIKRGFLFKLKWLLGLV